MIRFETEAYTMKTIVMDFATGPTHENAGTMFLGTADEL
jgi:hypothetical protein